MHALPPSSSSTSRHRDRIELIDSQGGKAPEQSGPVLSENAPRSPAYWATVGLEGRMNGAHAAVQRRKPQSECTKCLIEGAGWFVLGWLRMTEKDIMPGVPVAEMEWMKRAVAIDAPRFLS